MADHGIIHQLEAKKAAGTIEPWELQRLAALTKKRTPEEEAAALKALLGTVSSAPPAQNLTQAAQTTIAPVPVPEPEENTGLFGVFRNMDNAVKDRIERLDTPDRGREGQGGGVKE